MKEKFDFENLKGKESYAIPDGFFDEITAKSLKEAKRREINTTGRRIALYGGGAVAAMLVSVFMLVREPIPTQQDITAEALVGMFSDSDLQNIMLAMDNDMFYAELDSSNE